MEKYYSARQAKDDNIIQHMCFACWIPKATDTHSEYVILIAFPRQQWLHEHASMLRYMYISHPVKVKVTEVVLIMSRYYNCFCAF